MGRDDTVLPVGMQTARRVLGIAGAVALLLGHAPAQPAAASSAALSFPGGCRKADHDSLQSCINPAHDGDRIRIRTNTVAGAIKIGNKSLSLEGADGHRPTIGGTITIKGTTGTRVVSLSRVKAKHGIVVSLTGGANHAVTLRHDTIKAKGSGQGAL